MTKKEIIKEFLKKSIFPIAIALFLFFMFRSLCTTDGMTDYFCVWILCGLPFGIGKMRSWFVLANGSLGVGVAVFILNFVLGGLIGGFVLLWKVLVAVYYIPVTIIRMKSAID